MATTDGNTNLPLFQINDPEKVIRLGLAGLELNNVPADTAFAVSHDGLGIQYDITGVKKTFTIAPNGVSWSDGTTTNTTGLERLSLVQQAFQAVELPPNATTLKLNDKILLDNGVSTIVNKISSQDIVISDPTSGTTNTNEIGINYISLKQNATTTPATTDLTYQVIQNNIHNFITGGNSMFQATGSTIQLNTDHPSVSTFSYTILTPDSITANNNVSGSSSATWKDIIASASSSNPTYDQVLGAGNTATNKFAFIEGVGSIGTSTSAVSNTSFGVQDTDGAGNQKSSNLSNANLGFASSVAFGYNDSINIALNNDGSEGSSGIYHTDNYPTPSPFKIQSDQNITMTSPTGEVALSAPANNIFLSGQNIQLQSSYLALPSISSNLYSQLENRGLNCSDTLNGFTAWYRNTSARISNTAGTIFSFLTNTYLQMVNLANDTMNLTAIDLRMTTNITGVATSSVFNGYYTGFASPTSQTGYYSDGLSSVLNTGGRVDIKSLGEVNVVSKRVGDITDFNLVVENTNTTTGANVGVPSVQTYKSGRNVAQNDYIASQSAYAKNYLGNKTEYTRITSQTTNSSVGGGDDGAIGIWCAVNGTTQ
jgi:hypothetical protein